MYTNMCLFIILWQKEKKYKFIFYFNKHSEIIRRTLQSSSFRAHVTKFLITLHIYYIRQNHLKKIKLLSFINKINAVSGIRSHDYKK